MKIEEVLNLIKNVKENGPGKYTGLCPAHPDTKPSLSITTGNDERILLKCHAGCRVQDIVNSLGLQMSDLFQDKKSLPNSKPVKNNTYRKTQPFEHYQLGYPTEKYAYIDENSEVIYYNCRFQLPNGDRAFRQCDASGLNWSTKNIKPKVPYNLPKVIESKQVIIVEGEKDVHTLAKMGFVGTCNVAGAGNWTGDLNQHFNGKQIYFLADQDEAGRKHIAKVFQSLNRHTEDSR